MLCECGCKQVTRIAARSHKERGWIKGCPIRFIPGHNARVAHGRITHGMTRGRKVAPEYHSYRNAKERCENPRTRNYHNYGGRGIQFRLSSFEEFFAELGPRPAGMSLDRIETDGHYEKGNIRWATRSEQRRNRRTK